MLGNIIGNIDKLTLEHDVGVKLGSLEKKYGSNDVNIKGLLHGG